MSVRPVKLTLDPEEANTLRVALVEWGEVNCVRDFRSCRDPFCREFAHVHDLVVEAMETAGGSA